MIYSVKLINPAKKSEYSMRRWRTSEYFRTVPTLQKRLAEDFKDILGDTHASHIEAGYVEPGHGAKGRQRWIVSDEDLGDMYKAYHGKKEIMLWVFTQCNAASGTGQKRPRPGDSGEQKDPKVPRTNFDAHSKKLADVEEIVDELREKHGSDYTQEQYNVWAHMIQMRKHQSRECAPDKPFFRTSTKKKARVDVSDIPGPSTAVGISPGKRIGLRTECMSQLDKLNSLFEKGIITDEQFQEMREGILSDIKKF